jgi:hypothetical protein
LGRYIKNFGRIFYDFWWYSSPTKVFASVF